METKVSIGLALVAIIIAIGAALHTGTIKGNLFGATGTGPTCGGNVTCLLGDLYASGNLYGNTLISLTTALVPGIFSQGSATLAAGLQQQVTVTTLSSGSFAASSTLATIANPFAATSTATIERLTLSSGSQATSTSLNIGTTTASTGLTSTNTSVALVNAGLVATSTVSEEILPGVTTMLGTGQVTAGSGTISKIIVGPNESIGVYATSTYGNSGALNYTPGLTGTLKIKWSI